MSVIAASSSESSAVKRDDPIAQMLLAGQLIAATLLQKVAITLTADIQLFLGFIILTGLTGFGVLAGRLEIRALRCVVYLIAMSVMALVQLAHSGDFSFPSLIMLMLVHLPYVFGLRSGLVNPGYELNFYVRLMSVFAIVGIVQFFAQYVVGVPVAFFMEHYFPKSFYVIGFNGLNPLGGGAEHFKSTGVFFLEPAIFCQFLALAVIIDVVYFMNVKRIILLLAAIAVTFSGTGLILLFLLMPFYLIERRQFFLLTGAGVAVVLSPLWAPLVGLGRFVNRAGEFFDPHSSGFARFVSMFLVLRDFVLPYPHKMLFGEGAGMIGAIVPRAVDYANFDPTWGKIIYEYGFFAATAYFLFLATLFTTARRSRYLKAALLIQFLVLGGYIIPPTIHGLIVALIVWPDARPVPVAIERKSA